MKTNIMIFTLFALLIPSGCTPEAKTFDHVWVDSSDQSQETIDSAIERLSGAGIEFLTDESGSVLIDENDVNRAVMCCS